MSKEEYLTSLFTAWNTGKISDEAYDAALLNAEFFCEEKEEFHE